MTALQERIQACEQLHRTADTPAADRAYFYELQGLLVAAGTVEPPASMDAEFVEAYERGLEDGRTLARLDRPACQEGRST